MAKNKNLVNQWKHLQKQVNNITPQVYAGIALTLSRNYGWTGEQIELLFAESQTIWTECVNSNVDMIEMCETETGIECRTM